MRATLRALKAKLRQRMHEPVNAVGAWLKARSYWLLSLPRGSLQPAGYVAVSRPAVRSVAVDAWPSQSAQPA